MKVDLWSLESDFSSLKTKIMKEQRSISVPGINLEEPSVIEADEDVSTGGGGLEATLNQARPSLFEVFMALKEREK